MQIEPGQTLSHYRLIEKIGQGGMGVVWKAEDKVLGRTVAIKVLPADASRDARRREMFLREARLASSVSAAHVAQVYEFDREGDLDFIVMEYVEGQPLDKLLHGRPLPPHKAAEFGCQLAHALSRAHRKKLLHRDLKPANVIVTPDGEVKVLDFGVATLFQWPDSVSPSQATTQVGDKGPAMGLAGTLPYMSPEQARMETLDARSDIFSLGTMLYEMTSGRLPFTGSTATEVLRAVQRARPTPVHDVVPQVPLELDRIIQKAMAPRRQDRYQDAQDLAVDLRRLGKDLESGSSPSYQDLATAEPGRRRKTRLVPLLVAGSVMVLIIGLASVLVYRQMGRPAETEQPPLRNRIVVLPFENLGPPTDQYFADGMTEEITSRLAVVSGLGVISRTSAMRYADRTKTMAEIGQELGVDYVLEGTVRWDREAEGHGRVRITPQLIRVTDDTHLWAEAYDRRLEDVFAAQSEIAEQVVHALGVALPASEQKTIEVRPTENMEAYNAYLRGIEIGYPVSAAKLDVAANLLERAAELDPGFAQAHAELARVHAWWKHASSPMANLELAARSIEEALKLAPDSPDVQRNAAWYYYWGRRDYRRAIEHFSRAIELRPSDSLAYLGLGGALRGRGKFEEGLRAKTKSIELDPFNEEAYRDKADSLGFLRRYAEADEYYRRAIELAPDNWIYYVWRIENYLLWDGNTERAEALLETWPGAPRPGKWYHLETLNRNWQGALDHLASLNENTVYRYLNECYCLLRLDKPDPARAACEDARLLLERELEHRPDVASVHSSLGRVYALLGRKQDAIREGRRAVELAPLSDHALLNVWYLRNLAVICAEVGEQDAAIEQLDHLLSIPSRISVPMLRLDPLWDPLRDNPRFSELLTKYEPKPQTR